MMIQAELLMLAQARAGNPMAGLIFPLMILAIFYFLMIVPQRRQVKAHQALVDSLQAGDKVVTAGGLVGDIVSIKDDLVQLRTGQSTVVVERSRVTARRAAAGASSEKADKK
jgi:preprotein translocase subunit YajC